MIQVQADSKRASVSTYDAFEPIRNAVEGSIAGLPGILLHPQRMHRTPADRAKLSERLDTAQAEREALVQALARAEAASKDPRAAAAVATLLDALAHADERVAFLENFPESYQAAEQAFCEAAAEQADAQARLSACEPDNAAGLTVQVATAQARSRSTLRDGWAVLDGFKASAAPICPELAAAQARAAELAGHLDRVHQLARDDSPLAVACEGPADNPHWAAISKARAARAKKQQ